MSPDIQYDEVKELFSTYGEVVNIGMYSVPRVASQYREMD